MSKGAIHSEVSRMLGVQIPDTLDGTPSETKVHGQTKGER